MLPFRRDLLQYHGQGIGFRAYGASGAPDFEVLAGPEQHWEDTSLQNPEWFGIPEKLRDVDRQKITQILKQFGIVVQTLAIDGDIQTLRPVYEPFQPSAHLAGFVIIQIDLGKAQDLRFEVSIF